jgi:L-ascorbate metabolism protein UlaG (beta-lactamase superfamily)
MQISWNGLSCFEIVTKTSVGEVVIATDPYDPSTGLRTRAMEAQLVTVSGKGSDNVGSIGNHPFVVDMPGEYEVHGAFAFASPAPTKAGGNLISRIESEDLVIAHLGSLDRELSDAELEQLKNVDILLIPVGGGRVLDAKKAVDVVAQVEPRVVIPMTYAVDGLKEKLEGVEAFTKALGATRKEETGKYKVTRKDLPEEEDTLLVLLSR